MRSPSLLTIVLFMVFSAASAQVEIPVNMYTGTPSISVPIYTVTSKDIAVPVSLSYSANSPTSNTAFGAGWSLQAGGSITREVRDFPDDISYFSGKKGWFYNTNIRDSIGSDSKFPSVDSLTSTTTNEATVRSKLNSYKNYDTEPDIFNYSFNGISGSFVIDNEVDGTGKLIVRTIPYHDIKVKIDSTSLDKKIRAFTITTNDGYKYRFAELCAASKKTTADPYIYSSSYLTREYEMYSTEVNYTYEWKLTTIESPNLNTIEFTYQTNSAAGGSSPREVKIGQYVFPDPFYADPIDLEEHTIYKVTEGFIRKTPWLIIASSGEKLEFSYTSSNDLLNKIELHDMRRGSTATLSYVKSYVMEYLPIAQLAEGYYTVNTIQFLASLTEMAACDRIPPVRFSYIGAEAERSHPLYGGPITFPLSGKGVDLWGFPNGATENKTLIPKLYIYPNEPAVERYRLTPIPGDTTGFILNGANRNPGSLATANRGVLSTITNPQNGITQYIFEQHTYLDTRTDQTLKAGGLRIKQIQYYDGASSTPVLKTFNYNDPVTGKSSGRLLRKPMLAMPVYKWRRHGTDTIYNSAYGAARNWKYLTMRRTEDLTPGDRTQGSVVGYKIVTVSRPGSGSARYEYEMPALSGAYATGKWKATSIKIARKSSSPSLGLVTNTEPWMYPYVPHPDYDYWRGLPSVKTEFNEAGTKVRKTQTVYQNIFKSGSEPEKVTGLRFEKFQGMDDANRTFFFGRYFLLTDAARVVRKETTTTYDLSDGTGNTFQKDSVEYFYQSANHKFVTQIKRTTSDGKIYSSFLKYPQDYPVETSGANDAVAIGTLQNVTTFRHGAPVEQYETLQRGTAIPRVIGGSVVKYDPMGISRPMVRSAWRLKANPSIRLDSFMISNIYTSSGKKLRIDRRYERVDSILSYTPFGDIESKYDPVTRQLSGTVQGYNPYYVPSVSLLNVLKTQAAFSDFETETDLSFQRSASYYGSGHSGEKGFYPGVMLYRNSIVKASVDNYQLAFWAKSSSTFTLVARTEPVGGGTPFQTVNIDIANSGAAWKYYQAVIPVTNATSTFRIELEPSSAMTVPPSGGPANNGYLSTLVPVIDDVFFYPENADMIAYTYVFPFGLASVTAPLGNTSYKEYDKLGRLVYERDKDRNIVSRTQYNFDTGNPLAAAFSIPTNVYVNEAATFTADVNTCVGSVTYSWDWGESEDENFVTGTRVQAHTFDSAGIYKVTLKVSNGTYTKTITSNVWVKWAPIQADYCAKGGAEFNTASGVSIVTNFSPCASISTSLPHQFAVIFKATPTNIGDEPCEFKWYFKQLGGFSWTLVSTSQQYIFPKVVTATQSFQVRCEMSTASGRSGETGIIPVIVNH